MNAKISVIVPTYNRESIICEAIESVLAQTYKDFEIIVIDDGSIDNTRSLLMRYGNKIKYIHQNNCGIAAARNRGIRESEGEYIAFLDSDDIWFPDKLEKQVKKIREDGRVDFVYCSLKIMENNKLTGKVKPFLPALTFNDLFLGKGSIPTSSCLIKRECFNNFGLFDESLRIVEDYELWLRFLLKCRIKYINESLGIYRQGSGNISNNEEAVLLNGIQICLKFKKNKIIPLKLIHKKLSLEYYNLARFYFSSQKYIRAARYVRKAIFVNPSIGINFSNYVPKSLRSIKAFLKPYFFLLFLLVKALFSNEKL